MARQEVKFKQSDWSQPEDKSSPQKGAGSVLKRIFSGFLAAVMIVLTAPFVIVMWTMNFIKSLFGTVIFWIVGKLSLFFILWAISWVLSNLLKIVSMETMDRVADWFDLHILGSSADIFMLPYFNIEIWLILGLAVLMATVNTLDKTQFNQPN